MTLVCTARVESELRTRQSHTLHHTFVPYLTLRHNYQCHYAGNSQLSQGDLTHHLQCLGQVPSAFWSCCISKLLTKQQRSYWYKHHKHHTLKIFEAWFCYLMLILCFRRNKLQRSTQLKQQGQLAKACEIPKKPVAKRNHMLFKCFMMSNSSMFCKGNHRSL